MKAYRAKHVHTLAGEGVARGAALRAPLQQLDNAILVVDEQGLLVDVCTGRGHKPTSCPVVDLGDVTVIPGVVNAHTHIQLSALAGQTRFGEGFVPWLVSLLPHMKELEPQQIFEAIFAACAAMQQVGTAAVGDIVGSTERGLRRISRALRQNGILVRHFCEWFGFGEPFLPPPDDELHWPLRVRMAMAKEPEIHDDCAPCGHALYSTAASVLQRAKTWCVQHGHVFSMHLAESPEETELLLHGTGALRHFYAGVVLPSDWRAPGVRPLAYAQQLGLLGQGTLAVHGTQLEGDEITTLAASGTALCLCPRSNQNLAVGEARIGELLASQTLLCLGTDGLSSNTDLNVLNEAVFLRERHDVPRESLVRLLTVNGAAALGLPAHVGRLVPGQLARFAILPS